MPRLRLAGVPPAPLLDRAGSDAGCLARSGNGMGVGQCPASRIFGRLVYSNSRAEFKRGADSGHGGRAPDVSTAGRRGDADGNSRLESAIHVEPTL